ncbi:serine/threonine-protein kinase PLK1-like isoform X2 [Contarinia nasturtii]|uniref:serine/threonine-protein kinase PLK1-like isoform X2 n=1 Tax=Contarinia nasturtii TaxID=265458 RepID=UPI0012D3D552|nr:serine/threonine-protein kinase PLK1-like isoform X2 [Contarinia nasturtii]
MSIREKKTKKVKCYADLVSNVPELIVNSKNGNTYERLHFIGQGSYGKCYEVVKTTTKERLACKTLSFKMTKDSEMQKIIQAEISIHRKLMKHPHIVQYIESFDDGSHVYMIQELCSNHSLRDLQKTRGTVSTDECRYFVSQVLKGAQYIHECKIIHRDIKLSNVLIDKNMQLKICDFGLAIKLEDPRMASRSLCGTTNYLAPEVIMRKGFQTRSDVWAIGVICFVLLFGYKPFEEGDAFATHERILSADYKITADVDSEVKAFFRAVFNKEVTYRSSAEQCLQLAFFSKHNIPKVLPTQTLTQMSFSEAAKPSSCNYIDVNVETKDVTYQEICVKMGPILPKTFKNINQVRVLEDVFDRFNAMCRYYIQSDQNLSDISDVDTFNPVHWVNRWSFDQNSASGFAYELSDGTTGMIFHEGLRFMRTPKKRLWAWQSNEESFREVKDDFDAARLDHKIQKFDELETTMLKNGSTKIETAYNYRKKVFVYTWFQTDEATVMLLSNHTIQINFTQGHKKMLISPLEGKVTFITHKMELKNFKTLAFEAIGKYGFSYLSFVMFKYVTAIVQRLAYILK